MQTIASTKLYYVIQNLKHYTHLKTHYTYTNQSFWKHIFFIKVRTTHFVIYNNDRIQISEHILYYIHI